MVKNKIDFYGPALALLSFIATPYAMAKEWACDYKEYETVYSIYHSDTGASPTFNNGRLSWHGEQQADGTWKLYFKDSSNSFIKNMTTIKNGYTIQADLSAERTYNIGSSQYYSPFLEKTQQYITSTAVNQYLASTAPRPELSIYDPKYVDPTIKALDYKGQYKIEVIPNSTRLISFNFELSHSDTNYPSSYKYDIDINKKRANEYIEITNFEGTYFNHRFLVLENCNF